MDGPNSLQVLEKINTAKKSLQNHQDELPTHLYNAMDCLSRTVLAFLESKGAKGWATTIKSEDDELLWTPEQAQQLEQLVPRTAQRGGAMGLGTIKLGMDSNLIKPIEDTPTQSLDDMVANVRSYLASIDQKNKEFAKVLGPVAIVNSMTSDVQIGPVIPWMPTPLMIPPRALLPIFNALLETCRILASSSAFDSPFLRKLFSIVLGIYDVSRGEWRDGVLSFLGVFSESWMYFGIMGKTFRWVYNFISPDLQVRLEDDVFASMKSAFIGGWLWLASVVSPTFIRVTINNLVETAKKPIEELNKTLEQLSVQATESAKQLGVKVEFPRIPLDKIPSFDDIQNFQAILHQPEIVCSPVFQRALGPAMEVPVLRVFLELLNIPTNAEKMAEFCKGTPPSVAEAITETLTPVIVPAEPTPEQKGGSLQVPRRRLSMKRRKALKL